MRVVSVVVLAVALGAPLRAEVTVRAAGSRVDVTANAAPLADVLDRLARQTGMKVVYEGPAPRQLVTVSLLGRSPAEAVHDLLEGQGLNYALLGDSSGTGVQTLLMTGQAASVGSSSSASSSSTPALPPGFRGRGAAPPPMSSADAIEEAEDEPEEEPATDPAAANGAPGATNNEGAPGGANPAMPGATPPGVGGPAGLPNPLLQLLPGVQGTGAGNPTPGSPVQTAPAAPRTMMPPTTPGFVPVNPLSPLGPFAPVIPAQPGSPAGTPGSPTEPVEPKEPPL
jgi:hypothetical protein